MRGVVSPLPATVCKVGLCERRGCMCCERGCCERVGMLREKVRCIKGARGGERG